MDEQSQVSRATRDLSIAFSNSLFARLFVRVSLSSAVERFSETLGAGLSSDIARPSKAEQVRAAVIKFSQDSWGFLKLSPFSRVFSILASFLIFFRFSSFLNFRGFLEPTCWSFHMFSQVRLVRQRAL